MAYDDDLPEYVGATKEIRADGKGEIVPAPATVTNVTVDAPAPKPAKRKPAPAPEPEPVLNDDLTLAFPVTAAKPAAPFQIYNSLGGLRSAHDFSEAELANLSPEAQDVWGRLMVAANVAEAADAEMNAALSLLNTKTRSDTTARTKAAAIRTGFEELEPNPADVAVLRNPLSDHAARAAAGSAVASIEYKNRSARLNHQETIRLAEVRRMAWQNSGLPRSQADIDAEAKQAATAAASAAAADAIIAASESQMTAARARLDAARIEVRHATAQKNKATQEWSALFAVPTQLDLARIMQRQTQERLAAIANGTAPEAPKPARPEWPMGSRSPRQTAPISSVCARQPGTGEAMKPQLNHVKTPRALSAAALANIKRAKEEARALGIEPKPNRLGKLALAALQADKGQAQRGAHLDARVFALTGTVAKPAKPITYSGAPCVRCGGTERYTRNNDCAACARKAARS